MNANKMKNLIKESHYKQYQKLIFKLAHFYKIRYKLPIEELISEGNLIYAKCYQDFYSGNYNCRFITFLYNNLRSKLKYYCQKSLKRAAEIDISECKFLSYNFNENSILLQYSISDDLKCLIDYLVTEPSLIDATRYKIKKFLYNQTDWQIKRILNVFTEAKSLVKVLC